MTGPTGSRLGDVSTADGTDLIARTRPAGDVGEDDDRAVAGG